jgi:hypothetical protein
MTKIADDPVLLAWQSAPMGTPLSDEEQDLAEEGLAAVAAGETVGADEVHAELEARHRTAG